MDFDDRKDPRIDQLTSLTYSLIPSVKDGLPASLAETPLCEQMAFFKAAGELGMLQKWEALFDGGVLEQTSKWRFGIEHEVYWREGSETVWKATYTNRYGLLPWKGEATPLQYLSRLNLCNILFGDEIQLECIADCGGETPRVITSQPYVRGQYATVDEIHAYMERLGFQRKMDRLRKCFIWVSEMGGNQIVVGDLHSKNVLKTEFGKLVVIDGIVAARPQ